MSTLRNSARSSDRPHRGYNRPQAATGDGNFPNFQHDFGGAVREAARCPNLTGLARHFTHGLKFSEFRPS
jgi:hypothetical protein